MPHEVEATLVRAAHAISAQREPAAVAPDEMLDRRERRPEAGGEDDVVELLLRTVRETHTRGREALDPGSHHDAAGTDLVDEMKPDQRDRIQR